METNINLTVFFEEQFWIGIFEKSYSNHYEICKVVFGSEPKDAEIYQFILANFNKLKFSNPTIIPKDYNKKINPKRLQRKIKEETKEKGVGTKAQNALKIQYEENKNIKKSLSKQKKELNKERRFTLKQDKKKEKKKGH